MAYSIDGEHFASCASGDPNIALSPFVDMKGSDLAATQQPFQAGTLEGHSGEVMCLAYSSLGLLASAGSDSEIRLWAPSPQPGNLPILTAVLADNACIWKTLNFSSGGLLLFAGGSNQVASWQLTPPPKPKPTTSVTNASSTARRSSQAENATKSFRARSAGRWEAREGRIAMQETHFEGRCRARLRYAQPFSRAALETNSMPFWVARACT
jgi:WD40 repeat protein